MIELELKELSFNSTGNKHLKYDMFNKGGKNMEKLRDFKRYLEDKSLIEKIKQDSLFRERLLEDIKKGKVYPAIREKNIIDFYFYKSLLFQYNGEFVTHPKFAFVPEKYGEKYVSNGSNVGEIADFYAGYENIKERAKLYASIEDIGVFNICKNGNFLTKDDYIVLDVEVAFGKTITEEPTGTIEQIEGTDSKKKKKRNEQNRIDILLYNIKEKELLFLEAKHFSNKEIWSEDMPDVVKQVNRYNKDIEQRYPDILKIYKEYINNLNELFKDELKKPLPTPEKIYNKCGLIIFGFDANQRDGRLIETKQKIESANIKVYTIGDESKINVKTLYNYIKNNT